VLRFRPDTDVLRATGTSVDPNMLGALLIVAGAILVPQLLAARPLLPRTVAAGLLAPIVLCLLLTESRSSWLGLAGAVGFVALKHRRLWPLMALAAPLALSLPPAQRFVGHLLSGLRAQDRAAAMRIGEFQNALTIIARHPWFGAGWSSEGKSIELAFTLGVSNVLLTVAERSGLIAAACYLAALAALALTLWPAVRRSIACDGNSDDGLLLGLAAALVATQIAGLADHHFVRFPHLVTLLWMVAALAVAATREEEPTTAAAAAPGHGSIGASAPRRQERA
jgi:O-antigen ligase